MYRLNSTRKRPCSKSYKGSKEVRKTVTVFNQFLYDCQTNIEIDGVDDKAFTDDLVGIMANLYEKEVDRNNALQEAFDHHKLHFASTNVDRMKFCTDGEIQIYGHRYVIIEIKNEVAVASAEPYFQAIQYYVGHTRVNATKYRSSLPYFLVCITGECS